MADFPAKFGCLGILRILRNFGHGVSLVQYGTRVRPVLFTGCKNVSYRSL
jgi:hypothetical protein